MFIALSRNGRGEEELMHAKLYTVCLDGKCGYVDGAGNYVIPPRFEAANPFVNGRAWVRENGLIGVIDAKGEWLIPPRFRNAKIFAANGLAAAQSEDGKYGFIDATGAWVIPPRFREACFFAANGLAQAMNEHGRWGFIDAKGAWAIPPQFSEAFPFEANGLAAACNEDENWGFIDATGTWVIPARFEIVGYFAANGLAAAWNEGGYWGFIDAAGAWVIPPRLRRVRGFAANGLAGTANEDEKWGFIDAAGAWAIPPRFKFVGDCFAANGLVEVVGEDGEWFFIDRNAIPRLAVGFDQKAEPGRWELGETQDVLYDDNGQRILAVKRGRLMPLYTVCLDGKCGYVDGAGNFVIPPRFEAANPFVEGRAWVREDGLIGAINAQGEWAIPPRFKWVYDFAANGLAKAENEDGKEIHIDRNAVPRLEVGFDQKAEACRWEFGKAQDTLRDGEGRRILIRSTLCGVEVAKSAAGDLLWPRKTEAQICEDSLARRRWEKETGRDAGRP